MLAEALNNIGFDVVEELSTGPEIYNQSVQVTAADFEPVYLVDNIRTLGKRGFKDDKHRQPILNKVKEIYSTLYDMTFEEQKVETNTMFGGDFGGDFGDDFGSNFSNGFGGSDMFMSNMPTPTKTVKSVVTASSNSPDSVLTPPEPPASSTEKKEETVPVVAVDTGFGGFSFSMDEDF
jgi:hypothetical protein